MSAEDVLFVVEDGIATITLNRPQRRNALSVAVSNRLTTLWEEIDIRDDVLVVILTSADCGTFCAGMDLKEAAEIKQTEAVDVLTRIRDPFHTRMRRLKVPLIAAMTGHLMAGGMLLSLNCDLRVGLAGSRAGITEVKIGRGSPWAVPLLWMLPQPFVMEMVLTGELLPIERFQEFGFINYLEADPDAVRARAKTLAAAIRAGAPLSVAAGKASLLTAMSAGCDAGLAIANRIYQNTYASEDAVEGPRAFAEKRKPNWKGC
jgi:enoyl-CoA hydratase/carnithine racemase